MAFSREDYLKKFKRLTNMNESIIKQVQEMDLGDEDEVPFASGVVGTASANEAEGDNKDQSGAPAADAGEPSPEAGAENDPIANAPLTPQQTQSPTGNPSGDSSVTAPEPEAELGAEDSINSPDVEMSGGMGMDTQGTQDDIQNELLKLQVSALQKMSSKFDELELQINDLNNKMERYSLEVEKVKEPNPVEKIESRWEDSYPFKYRLNDLWNGNEFQGRHDLFPKQNDAVRQTDDGSYIASYGDMKTVNDFDLKKSFHEGVEKLQKKINEAEASKKSK
jgi:hypothetical protein